MIGKYMEKYIRIYALWQIQKYHDMHSSRLAYCHLRMVINYRIYKLPKCFAHYLRTIVPKAAGAFKRP